MKAGEYRGASIKKASRAGAGRGTRPRPRTSSTSGRSSHAANGAGGSGKDTGRRRRRLADRSRRHLEARDTRHLGRLPGRNAPPIRGRTRRRARARCGVRRQEDHPHRLLRTGRRAAVRQAVAADGSTSWRSWLPPLNAYPLGSRAQAGGRPDSSSAHVTSQASSATSLRHRCRSERNCHDAGGCLCRPTFRTAY